MDDIVHSIGGVNDTMPEIAAGSREQTSVISQINSAIAHMVENTQQNAARWTNRQRLRKACNSKRDIWRAWSARPS